MDLDSEQLIDKSTGLEAQGVICGTGVHGISTFTTTNDFQGILEQFLDITPGKFKASEKKNNVVHHIITQGPLIAARVRRLSPEKLEAAKAEFDYMIERGICRPSSGL